MRKKDEDVWIHDEGECPPESGRQMIPNTDLSPKERRWVILGALSSALLIALAFLAGLGIIVALMLIFW